MRLLPLNMEPLYILEKTLLYDYMVVSRKYSIRKVEQKSKK